MPDDQKPDVKLIEQAMAVEPASPRSKQEIRETVLALARVLQRQNTQPEVALTAMLNLIGSILGTRFDAMDRQKWIAQFQTMIPAYTEAYRVKEKKI